MADAFSQLDAKALLSSKYILFLGDSNMRAQYKDLIWLLNSNTLIEHAKLRSKLERSYLGDKLITGSKLHRGRDFQENRKYTDDTETTVEFAFITRCYNSHIEELFCNIKNGTRPVPNVVVVNSCLWDLTRWGPKGVPTYKDNMVKLMRLMSQSLPKECLVIWTTTLPTAAHVQGGLIIKQIEFMQPLLRFEVMEANTFARDVVVSHGFDVLDNHYHTRMQMHRRAKDGIHYLALPVRLMTNLLLTHIALSWGSMLPGNVSSVLLDKAIALDCKPSKQTPVKMPTGGIFSKINLISPTPPKTNGLKIKFETNEEKSVVRKCRFLQEERLQSGFNENRPYARQKLTYQQISPEYQGTSERYHGMYQNYQAIPQNYQAIPQNYQGIPQNYQAIPQNYQAIPQNYQAIPQNYQAIPQNYQAIPQNYQGIPQNYQAIPQNYQAIPQNYQGIPQNYQAIPQNYQAVPQNYQALNYQPSSSSHQQWQVNYEESNVGPYRQNKKKKKKNKRKNPYYCNHGIYQNYQAIPQNYQAIPQNYQGIPQNYQAIPQNYQAVPQNYQALNYQPSSSSHQQWQVNYEESNVGPYRQNKKKKKKNKRKNPYYCNQYGRY